MREDYSTGAKSDLSSDLVDAGTLGLVGAAGAATRTTTTTVRTEATAARTQAAATGEIPPAKAAAPETPPNMTDAAGQTVYRNVPETHPGLPDAKAGTVKPWGETRDMPAEARADMHDSGMTKGSGFTSWTTDPQVAQARQAQNGGITVQTQAPAGSVHYNAAAKGQEAQVLVPGEVQVKPVNK